MILDFVLKGFESHCRAKNIPISILGIGNNVIITCAICMHMGSILLQQCNDTWGYLGCFDPSFSGALLVSKKNSIWWWNWDIWKKHFHQARASRLRLMKITMQLL